MRDHAAALDYDLMTATGRTLDEYADMGPAGTVALVHFVRHVGPDSALWRETHPGDDVPAWHTVAKTNAELADLYDAVASINANLVQSHVRHKVRRPKPYPRPQGGRSGETLGRGAVPVSSFESWWKSG